MIITVVIAISVLAGYGLGLWTCMRRWPAMRRQVQHNTLRFLADPKLTATLDLIMAEMETRQATKIEATE